MQILDCDFERLVTFVKYKYGIDLKDKKFLVETRLTNYILDCGFKDFTDYCTALYNDTSGREVANMINRITTNHTYFMRETDHFEHFMKVFLKQAVQTKTDHELCIWSAGCSFGNEPYNLAMCANEFFGDEKKNWDCRILATDVSFHALRNAKNGMYPEQDLEQLPPGWREKYFRQRAKGIYQVTEDIRNDVIFKYHNLMEPIEFKKKFDLILCRNVMIYFDERTKSMLCRRFYDASAEGGYLYIGHAEAAPDDMKYIKEKTAIYRKITEGGER